MNKAADSTTKSSREADPFALGTLALDLLNTAWRIAVPVLLFAVAGLLLDRKLDSAPWLTLLGTVVGFGFAYLLVKKQIEIVNRREEKK